MINKNKPINYGLQILRMFSSFWVVINHCYDSFQHKRLHYYLYQKPFHVPNFMFLSFYFYYKHLKERQINKIIQRFQRLLIPYIIWPFIYLITNNICLKFFGWSNYGRYLSFKDYFIQIIIGSRYLSIFWYLTVLLFLSIFFTIVAFLIPNYFLFIIKIVGFLFYGIHRSSIYDYLIKNKLFYISLVLTIRFAPISVIGLTFSSLNIIKNIENHFIRNIIINVCFLYFLFRYNIFNFNDIFIYQDVDTITIGSINFFCIFSLLPLKYIENEKIILILKYFTNYTGGIYYIHILTRNFLKRISIHVKQDTFFGVIIIYINTYFISFFGNKIFKKTIIKHLFN